MSTSQKWNDSSDFGPWVRESGGRHPDAHARALTAQDHLLQFGTVQVAATAHPGPVILIDINDTAAERAVKEMAFKVRTENLIKFEKEKAEDLAYKTMITTESPPEATEAISHGVHGLLRHSTSTMLAALRAIYGTVSAAAFENKKASMPTSCGPSPAEVIALINEHKKIHDLGESIGQAMSEADKVTKIMAAMPREFDMDIKLFKNSHPTLATRTFAAFTPLMISAAEDFACSSKLAYSVAAQPKQLEELVANAVAVAMAVAHGPKPGPKPGPAPGARQPQPYYYCWTHGKVKHASKDCNAKAPGHVDNATFRNTQGGKDPNVVWARGMTPGP